MTSIRPMVSEDIPTIARWIAAIPLGSVTITPPHARSVAWSRRWRGATCCCDRRHGRRARLRAGLCLPRGALGRSTYLRLLCVQSGLHGAGLGAALLDAAEQEAARSAGDLMLLVSDFNLSAQRFYQRQGYRKVGAIPGYVLPDVTELIFWKRLAPSGAS